MRGVLALLGSGETAPGMTKVHRQLLARHANVRAVNLESPYGFQANVAQVTEKLVDYFERSLHTTLTSLALTNYERASEAARERVKSEVRRATYVFAGPGSPSYALAQWRPLNLVADLRAQLDTGGTVCFSSAAVLTLGSHTAPIYEIYKVGSEPSWLEGLDLFSDLGLACAAIPHFDNAEGRNYDTRYCYLGEERLLALEEQLPTEAAVLGVDEHTALLFELERDTVTVTGRSAGHWRHHGETLVLNNGTTTPLDTLRDFAKAPRMTPRRATSPHDDSDAVSPDDTHSNAYDPRPLIENVLALRSAAKSSGNFTLADALRDVLTMAGVEVHDRAGATTWELPS
jgi:hypothetical protein